MGYALFIADDPAQRTEGQLEKLVPRLHGVAHWQIGPQGEVTIEYDETTVSLATITEALQGLGFRVQPVADDPTPSEATGTQNTVRGATGASLSPGHVEP